MKQKYEGKDLRTLVELGREQGYLTFDQVNDFLPQEVSSPTDLRSALESFQDMGNFQLLSQEQEVEIAKRIEAGENEVEEEILRSPVTLDLVIETGARAELGEANLRDLFEENEAPTDADEERGR